MTDLAAIITKHVDACVAELRDAVRAQMLAALGEPPSPSPTRRRATPRRAKGFV